MAVVLDALQKRADRGDSRGIRAARPGQPGHDERRWGRSTRRCGRWCRGRFREFDGELGPQAAAASSLPSWSAAATAPAACSRESVTEAEMDSLLDGATGRRVRPDPGRRARPGGRQPADADGSLRGWPPGRRQNRLNPELPGPDLSCSTRLDATWPKSWASSGRRCSPTCRNTSNRRDASGENGSSDR